MKDTIKALQEKNSLPLNSRPYDWKIEDDLLFYKGKCYIPDNLKLRQRIAELYHDSKDTQANYKLKNLSNNITGGLDYTPS